MDNVNDQPHEFTEETPPEKTIEEQGRDQTGQKKVRVRIDERNLQTSYVSGFRPTMTAEEVMLDLASISFAPRAIRNNPLRSYFKPTAALS